jgi:type II secretory pathway pseudopilin PulG
MQLIKGNRSNKGDTIVEFMLALSVLGLIIVGGYSIATRSLNGVRVSQERGEALKIAEAQIETVRQKISSTDNYADILNGGFAGANPTWGVATGKPAYLSTPEYGFCVGA